MNQPQHTRSAFALTLCVVLALGLTACDANQPAAPTSLTLRGAVTLPADAATGSSVVAPRQAAQEGEVEADVAVDITTSDGSMFVSEAEYEIEVEDGEIDGFFRGRDVLNGEVIDAYTVDVT